MDAQEAVQTTETEQLRQQLKLMQQQMQILQQRMAAQPPNPAPANLPAHQSREYWALPISDSVKYPGEDATNNAKIAYQQQLDAYLRKSSPVWDLVSDTFKCPITTDAPAMDTLRLAFGELWTFQPKDINRALSALQRDNADAFDRVSAAMRAGSESRAGSWEQRNTAIYTVICDTLDLSKTGKDLEFLEIAHANNGLSLYNLVKFRLRQIKSTDPLARAIKLKMGLEHIKYESKPHGIAKYFAAVEAHRTELAALPRPKIIDDWEVVAKALRELPQVHPQLATTAHILAVQRKINKTETTLEECREAFISAEIDNDIGAESRGKKSGSKKRLRANPALSGRRLNPGGSPAKSGRYNLGDCVHHPKSNTHRTCQCTNPFGIRSAFGRATSYSDKCAAVKASLQAGWSPKATNVKIPQGYGCDDMRPSSGQLKQNDIRVPQIRANAAVVPTVAPTITAADFHAYQRVQAIMNYGRSVELTAPVPRLNVNAQVIPQTMHSRSQQVPQASSALPMAPTPIRAYHPPVMNANPYQVAAHAHQTSVHQLPHYQQHQQPRSVLPAGEHMLMGTPHAPGRDLVPKALQANVSNVKHTAVPPPTDDDIIAAGLRYYAAQSGNQHFR